MSAQINMTVPITSTSNLTAYSPAPTTPAHTPILPGQNTSITIPFDQRIPDALSASLLNRFAIVGVTDQMSVPIPTLEQTKAMIDTGIFLIPEWEEWRVLYQKSSDYQEVIQTAPSNKAKDLLQELKLINNSLFELLAIMPNLPKTTGDYLISVGILRDNLMSLHEHDYQRLRKDGTLFESPRAVRWIAARRNAAKKTKCTSSLAFIAAEQGLRTIIHDWHDDFEATPIFLASLADLIAFLDELDIPT